MSVNIDYHGYIWSITDPTMEKLMTDESMMRAPLAAISPFDAIKHSDENGAYWSARELATLIGYRWQNFEEVIAKAQLACTNSQQRVEDHFVTIVHQIPRRGGKGKYPVKDHQLSRYACYLIIENADPSKEIVALGQTYFALRTRHDELAQEREEMQARLVERGKLAKYRKALYKTARLHGVITAEDFAIFENHGYLGLYHETAQQILSRKGLKPTDNPSDYMGVLETAADGFRVALANEMLSTHQSTRKEAANRTHERAGTAVRKTMEDMGVPTPEQLPTPSRSIQQVKRELARQRKIEDEDRLGLWSALAHDDTSSQG